jgi:hypothetical protein
MGALDDVLGQYQVNENELSEHGPENVVAAKGTTSVQMSCIGREALCLHH